MKKFYPKVVEDIMLTVYSLAEELAKAEGFAHLGIHRIEWYPEYQDFIVTYEGHSRKVHQIEFSALKDPDMWVIHQKAIVQAEKNIRLGKTITKERREELLKQLDDIDL